MKNILMIGPGGTIASEMTPEGLTPEETVCHISRQKSGAVQAGAEDIVITADTMVYLDGKRLGKPRDEADALRMLSALQGRHHTVCTGVTVRQGERLLTRAQSTQVWFREAATEELPHYIRSGEPMDKAGAYGIQEWIGCVAIEGIRGSFYNVMGLPTYRLYRELRRFLF